MEKKGEGKAASRPRADEIITFARHCNSLATFYCSFYLKSPPAWPSHRVVVVVVVAAAPFALAAKATHLTRLGQNHGQRRKLEKV